MYEVSSGRVVGRAAAALLCAAVLLAGAFALPSPASAAVVPAPSALTVLAGDMVDVLAWTPPRTGVAASYRIESAPAESGPWTVVGKTTTPRYTDRLRTPALLYYRVVAIDRAGKASPPSLVVSNAQVAIESLVTATGATLRAANGALSLTLPAGTFSAPTRVRVTQPANAPAQRVGIAVTPAYDFYASAALAKPASVTMAYTIPVKHFQVAAGLAAAIELATFEAASSKWVPVPTTVDTAAGTLSAQMPHFSYWEGTIIQPHGTSPAKTSYCDGICHNLAVAPGSQTVLTTTDSQVCYNCHGSDGLSPTPAGATGANVQADVFACTGQTFDPVTQSRHPVPAPGTTAGLACTRCHDPHADPTASPNLLRAQDAVTGKAVASKAGLSPGNPFCWACHGTRKNASVDRAVAGYYTRTGDKKTAFQYTPHANGPQITRIFALPNDFGRGTLTGAEAPASGGLIPTEHENIALGAGVSFPTGSPSDVNSSLTNGGAYSHVVWASGDFVSPGERLDVEIDLDLGTPRTMRTAKAITFDEWPQEWPERLQVLTSVDGITWVDAGTLQAEPGTLLREPEISFPRRSAQFVRFRMSKVMGAPETPSSWLSLKELEVYEAALSGSFISEAVQLADEGNLTSSKVVWASSLSGGATARVWIDASPDGGNTWVGETEAVNGGPLEGLPTGTPLNQVLFRWRTELERPAPASALRLKAISFAFGTDHTWSAATWPGSTTPQGSCANCHSSHGGPYESLTLADGNYLCVECHNEATPDRPQSYSFRDSTVYEASAHGAQACTACHPAHGGTPDGVGSASLIPKTDGSVCMTCHSGATPVNGVDVAAGFTASSDPLAHHDAAPGAQSLSSANLGCDDCHNPHLAKPGQSLTDPDAPGTLMPVSTSVPADSVIYTTGEMDIPVIADTTLDEDNPDSNYGASTAVTVDAKQRGLLRADVDALPPGIYVTSAELRVRAPEGERAGDIAVRSLTEQTEWWAVWSEGTGNGDLNTPEVNGATWNERWDADTGVVTTWGWPVDASWGMANDADGNWTQAYGGAYENSWNQGNAPFEPYSIADVGSVPAGEPTVTLDVTTQIRTRYGRANDNYNPTDILLMAYSPGAYLHLDSRDAENKPYVHVHYYRTSVLLEATADTSIRSDTPESNFGGAQGLVVAPTARTLLKFDVSSIPADAIITSARLRVFGSTRDFLNADAFIAAVVATDWQEGTGFDDPNPGAAGATWLEAAPGTEWASPGGDLGTNVARTTGEDYNRCNEIGQWVDLVGFYPAQGTGLIDALREDSTKGLAVYSNDGNELWFASRESGRAPVLEVQYSLADPDSGVSSIEFCTRCHDDGMPGDIGTYSPTNFWTDINLAANYQFISSHGYGAAKGPASRPEFDATSTLKPPYFYGMGPLQCTECHDPHGSKNVFHLKDTINGVSGLTVLDPQGNSEPVNQEAWCAACHDIRPHEWWGTNCIGCHQHGRTTGRRF